MRIILALNRAGRWVCSGASRTTRRSAACRRTCSAAGLVSPTTCCRPCSEAESAAQVDTAAHREPTTTLCARQAALAEPGKAPCDGVLHLTPNQAPTDPCAED